MLIIWNKVIIIIFSGQNKTDRNHGHRVYYRHCPFSYYDVFPLCFSNLTNFATIKEASRGAAARSVTAKPTGCVFDPHSRRWNIYLNLYFHLFALVSRLSAALSSATQHAMPPEFGGKWGTKCLNTRFPLHILLCAGYSVKLILILLKRRMVTTITIWTCNIDSLLTRY